MNWIVCVNLWWGFQLGPSENLRRVGPPHYPRPSRKWRTSQMWGIVTNPGSRRITSSFTRSQGMRRNRTGGKVAQPRISLNNSKARGSNQKETLWRRGFLSKGGQPKGNFGVKPKGACFNCNEVGHYSKDCPKSKAGSGSFKVLTLNVNLAQSECNRLIFLKGKIVKRDVLCLLDTGASHNFMTRECVEMTELHLEELKAPIEVHFADGVPHPTTFQAKEVPLQLGNWRGKVDLLVSTLGGMDCILGMEFIIQNNVLIEGHNRLVRIPSKSGIVRVKAHELPCVGGLTIHFMLGKAWERKCVWGFGMMCVMRVLDKYEPKEATKLVTSPSA